MEELPSLLMRRAAAHGFPQRLRRRPARVVAAAVLAACAVYAQPANRTAYAVVAGTVFAESGRSLSGARISVIPVPESSARKVTKAAVGTSNAQGEFAVRIPAGSMRYNVRVEARGFEPAAKDIQIGWDERVELVFRLKPVSGEERRK